MPSDTPSYSCVIYDRSTELGSRPSYEILISASSVICAIRHTSELRSREMFHFDTSIAARVSSHHLLLAIPSCRNRKLTRELIAAEKYRAAFSFCARPDIYGTDRDSLKVKDIFCLRALLLLSQAGVAAFPKFFNEARLCARRGTKPAHTFRPLKNL